MMKMMNRRETIVWLLGRIAFMTLPVATILLALLAVISTGKFATGTSIGDPSEFCVKICIACIGCIIAFMFVMYHDRPMAMRTREFDLVRVVADEYADGGYVSAETDDGISVGDIDYVASLVSAGAEAELTFAYKRAGNVVRIVKMPACDAKLRFTKYEPHVIITPYVHRFSGRAAGCTARLYVNRMYA